MVRRAPSGDFGQDADGAERRQATQLISTMNASVDHAFADIDRQRGGVAVLRLRGSARRWSSSCGRRATTWSARPRCRPGLVGKLLFYFVLAVAVLVGGPFALGFWLGGVRAPGNLDEKAGG